MNAPLLTALLVLTIAAIEPPARPAGAVGPVTIAPATDSPPLEAPSFAHFRPSLHGFAFVNSFRGSPLPVPLGDWEQRLQVPDRYGLCGGMSFAAADFYLAGRDLRREVPQTTPPEQGTPQYAYLYQRQSASLGPMAVMSTRFLEWMQLPEQGRDGTHSRTLEELEPITQAVERGEPVMLGLVLVSAQQSRAVWNNHQVLVYSIEPTDGSPPTLRIYDPNYPDNDEVVLQWRNDPDNPRWERIAPREGHPPRITRIRGFFQMPYEPRTPPSLDE